ncbi:MAG: non-ribosomal peptide synthase/amino acid adenylation enzyme, partial [Daejeonella sp.]|nr:non-ribosomal peptide synthase/amino acid adenylation enzyme [Daejeonella sp.]
DRSEHMIIAILAVLKAGGAYVPVDPKYPQERIMFILQDTQAKVMLTNEVHYERSTQAARDLNMTIECIDDSGFESALTGYSTNNLKSECLPANLFYIVYTSGTTDNPKGVMIEHRHITTVIDAIRDAYDFEDVAKISAFTSFGFDVSSSEFFISLLYGNELHLLSENLRTDVKELSNYLVVSKIEYVYLPPVVLAALPKIDYKHLKTIIYAGEPCDFETGKYWSGVKRLYNYYGPSETNIATGKLIKDGDIHLIGKAVHNATVYVLDKNGDNLPVGATGELYIGGDAVARGYLNLPELTNSRFINNPFQSAEDKAAERNSRLYKTGDLVRFLPDGNLEYLGRNDSQVKIRGYRVELAEVEMRLALYPDVKQAIVLALQHTATNTKYLAGYYVSNEPIDSELILSYLGNHLPDYMVPAVLVHLKELPHTINGKVDRKALPDPGFTGNTTYCAPQNETQTALCKIYAEILGLESSEISVDDNFFRLGGNSIAAIKLISKLDEVFSKTVKVAAVYSYKTVRKLSELLHADSTNRVNITKSVNETGILSFAQERLLFIDLYEGGSHAYNIPVAFKLSPAANPDSFILGLRSIVNKHQVLRSVIKTDANGNSTQEVQDDTLLPLNVEFLAVNSQTELDEVIDKLFCHTFRLNEEYPIRVQVYNVNPKSPFSEKYIGLVIHHIAFDGWSADIMTRELISFYRYFEAETMGDNLLSDIYCPAPLSLQYKDFAAWQRGYLVGNVWSTQLAYWKSKLSGCVPLALPTDKKRPLKTNYEGADVHFEIDINTSSKLRQVARRLEVSMYSLLLSAYYLLLKGYSNQDDVVVGTPVANRHYAQLQDTIGFFANTLAIRQVIKSETTISDFIQQVSESVIEAQTHQDLPFEKLISELGLQHDASIHPVFQVMFGVQNFGPGKQDTENDLFSIYHTEASYKRKPAKFDLTTMLNDSEEVISGSFNYSTSLFEEATTLSYIDTYKSIIQQIAVLNLAENETQRISELNYLNQADHQKIVHEWNNTKHNYPSEKTIHQLFEEQVIRTPDNIALIYEDITLTYCQLNEKANQLAAYLTDGFSIEPDELVALCLDRSEHMLIAILGVLKAGGAYVPIDPSLPAERIN